MVSGWQQLRFAQKPRTLLAPRGTVTIAFSGIDGLFSTNRHSCSFIKSLKTLGAAEL